MLKVNAEGLHEKWLGEYARLAMANMAEDHGMGSEKAMILAPNADDDPFDFKVVKSFSLPKGSARLCLRMARAARSMSCRPITVVGAEHMTRFPEAAFCLSSLLFASFPRNTRTGVFKRTTGGLLVASWELEAEQPPETRPHVSFAGLGIILMNHVRQALCPTETDAGVIAQADQYWMFIE